MTINFISWLKTDDVAFRADYLAKTGEAIQANPLDAGDYWMVGSGRIDNYTDDVEEFANAVTSKEAPWNQTHYVNIANHVNIPQDLIYLESTNTVLYEAIKHTTGKVAAKDIKLAYTNARYTMYNEQPAAHDIVIKAAILFENTVYDATFSSASSVTLSKAFGSAVSDVIDVLLPAGGKEFYELVTVIAADQATAAMNISGFTNENPVVVTATGHAYLTGEKVRLKEMYTNEVINVTAITQANPGVVTAPSHGFTTGKYVRFADIAGMTNLNWETNGNITYKVVVLDADNFTLQSTSGSTINTTSYTEYVSGGTVTRMSELNYSYGGATYTVANPTENTFELSGKNGTTIGAYGSGGVAERLYTYYGTTKARTMTQDGTIYGKDPNTLITAVARGAKVKPLTAGNINATTGAINSIQADPDNGGQNYTAALIPAAFYGIAGTNRLGALHPGTGFGGWGDVSGGKFTSYTMNGNGSLHDPNNPPEVFVGGTGSFASGWGAGESGVYGAVAIMGIPHRPTANVLLLGDSYNAGGADFPDASSGADEYMFLTQLGVAVQRMAVNGSSCNNWLNNNTQQLALIDLLISEGMVYTHFYNAMGVNDFQLGGWKTGTQNNINAANDLMRARGMSKIIVKQIEPSTESTDSRMTLANQTPRVVNGNTNAYGAGGDVEQYNADLLSESPGVTHDYLVNNAAVVRDANEPNKFKVSLFRGKQTGIITSITQANPALVTSPAHRLSNNHFVEIDNGSTMTQLTGSTYKIAVIDANSFTLKTSTGTALDSTAFTAFSGTGSWIRVDNATGDGVHVNGNGIQACIDAGLGFTL